MTAIAAALGACVVLLGCGGRVLATARLPAPMEGGSAVIPMAGPVSRLPRAAVAGIAAAALAAAAHGTAGAAAAAAGSAAVIVVLLERRASRTARSKAAAALPAACRVVAAELRAGALPADALAAAAAGVPHDLAVALHAAAAAERLGSSAAVPLTAAAPGAEAMWTVALGWLVCTETGAPLGTVLEEVAAALTAEAEARALVDVELAGVRLSALVMAALPAFGLALGASLGADPVGFLFGTAAGRCCLGAALLLDASGLVWVRALGLGAAR